MNTDDLRKRFEELAAKANGWNKGMFAQDHREPDRYLHDDVDREWRGFRMASKAALTDEQVEAIKAGIEGIACEDGEDYLHKDDPQGIKHKARQKVRNKHIAILRSLLPSNQHD